MRRAQDSSALRCVDTLAKSALRRGVGSAPIPPRLDNRVLYGSARRLSGGQAAISLSVDRALEDLVHLFAQSAGRDNRDLLAADLGRVALRLAGVLVRFAQRDDQLLHL